MEKNTLKHMGYKEKEMTLEAIFKEYRIAKYNLENDTFEYLPSHMKMIKEKNGSYQKVTYEKKLLDHLAKQNNYRLYIYYIENAMLHLMPNHREIIERDFITQDNRYWWESYYSRSTYYRHKKEAMCEMLSLLLSKTL